MQEKETCLYCIDIRVGHKLLGYLVVLTIFREIFNFVWIFGIGPKAYVYIINILATMWLAFAYISWFMRDRPISRARIEWAWLIYLLFNTFTSIFFIWLINDRFSESKESLDSYFQSHQSIYPQYNATVTEKDNACKDGSDQKDYCAFYTVKVQNVLESLKEHVCDELQRQMVVTFAVSLYFYHISRRFRKLGALDHGELI